MVDTMKTFSFSLQPSTSKWDRLERHSIKGKIAEIGIACDSELGKTMRIGDSSRDSVMTAVTELIEEAKSAAATVIRQLADQAIPAVDPQMLEILQCAKTIETLRQKVEAMGTDAIPNAGKSNEPLL
ncbi:unnamed protein product [Heligmosomoides polygyrus]|uniref:BLOC-1-related complex subunit 7 n=1 Tax=Heligmosomoides polygyrus TaxID=6339 RepID=A0A183G1D7_HELPZ|nr:unnamed protein product [Heligmosomoides polygyrus]